MGYALVGDENRLFPPQTALAARNELLALVQRSPRLCGLQRSRWWLDGFRQLVSWLTQVSLSGVHQILQRLKIHYKRGRQYVHSPDSAYDQKMAQLAGILAQVRSAPDRLVLVYEDELSYYRQPSVAQGYAAAGSDEPYARRSYHRNCHHRIAGSLNALTGQFFFWQRSRFDRQTLLGYYQALQACYPQAEIIYVVQDNWPVHFHPDVLAGLANSRIRLLALPTYAPWTNPTEKVWRKLYQEVLHLHDHSDTWIELKLQVGSFLDQFSAGSTDLLRYVGLLTD